MPAMYKASFLNTRNIPPLSNEMSEVPGVLQLLQFSPYLIDVNRSAHGLRGLSTWCTF